MNDYWYTVLISFHVSLITSVVMAYMENRQRNR